MLLKELAWTLVLLSTGGIYLQLFLKREKKNMIKKKIIRLKKEVFFKMQNFKFSIKLHSEIYFIVSLYLCSFSRNTKTFTTTFLVGFTCSRKRFSNASHFLFFSLLFLNREPEAFSCISFIIVLDACNQYLT